MFHEEIIFLLAIAAYSDDADVESLESNDILKRLLGFVLQTYNSSRQTKARFLSAPINTSLIGQINRTNKVDRIVSHRPIKFVWISVIMSRVHVLRLRRRFPARI